jgi:hypothetical protein
LNSVGEWGLGFVGQRRRLTKSARQKNKTQGEKSQEVSNLCDGSHKSVPKANGPLAIVEDGLEVRNKENAGKFKRETRRK